MTNYIKFNKGNIDKLPKSNSLLNLKDQMRLEAEEERLREMERAFIYG